MKKEKAKRITLYIDKEIYIEFQIYAITINKSVSELVENHMKEIIGGKYENKEREAK